MSIITVRQTRDPFRANIEYIASCKVTLEANGDLNMKNVPLEKLNERKDHFDAIYKGKFFYITSGQLIPALSVKMYTSETDEPILSVIKSNDFYACQDRIWRAQDIKYLKESFSRAWTWLASPFCPGNDKSQTNKALPQASPQNLKSYFSGLRSSILTCLRRKDSGGYVRLEEDMVEKRHIACS
ncbi:hypothetical protein JOM56_010641 [Amanita muscaria]